MTSRHFGDLVASFASHEERVALTIRRFLKIERWTYRELQDRTYQTAHYLAAQDVRSGDRVMVVANNSPDWVLLFLGTELIGAILVPVDVISGPATVLRFVEQTEPKLIFRNRHFHPELDDLPTARVLEDLEEQLGAFPRTPPGVQLTGDEAGLIVFTSGTTADPKGVVATQKGVLANADAALRVVDVSPDWRFLSVLPLSHMYELTGGTLCPLSSGAGIFYLPTTSPAAIGRAFRDYRITTVLAVPELLVLLLARIRQTAASEGKSKQLAMASKLAAALPFPLRREVFREVHAQLGGRLDLVVTGGAPIPSDVATAWENMGVRTLQGYGLTEAGPILTMNPLRGRRVDSAGRPLDNVQLRIAEDREIQASGPSIFREYWRNPTATREAFTEDGWFKTGDAGSLEEGWLHIEGRLKFAIVLSSGLKVFPEDLEVVAEREPELRDICVVGVEQPGGEEVVAVVISDRSDREVDAAVDRVNAQVESWQRINHWRRWPGAAFPLTRLLKIDRRKVQDWANASGREPNEREEQEGEGEPKRDTIADLVRRSLGEPKRQIGDTDRLADLGLDSLGRLTVVALIEDQVGVSLEEKDVTPTTTVGGLRKLVAGGSPSERPPPRPSWPYRRWVRLLGDAAREAVIDRLVGIWVSVSVEGQDRLDGLDTPALYIFNHSDDFDGPVVYRALPRRIRAHLAVAAADDVMREHKILAFVIRFCFAGFNLARTEPYLPSLEYVGTLVDKGWSVVLAPEGRLSTDGVLQPFKTGIGMLAVNLDVPVVPLKTLGLFGTVPLHSRWPKRHSSVTVRIGEPVTFGRHLEYEEVTLMLHRIMEEL